MGQITEKFHKELNAEAEREPAKTVTVKGDTIKIIEKYLKGRTYSETVAYLIGVADELYTEFANRQTRDKEIK